MQMKCINFQRLTLFCLLLPGVTKAMETYTKPAERGKENLELIKKIDAKIEHDHRKALEANVKQAVIILGGQQEGKSAAINFLAGKQFITRVNFDDTIVEVEFPLEGMEISNSKPSKANLPYSYIDPHSGCIFFDVPQFLEGEINLISGHVVQKISQTFMGCKILFAISQYSINKQTRARTYANNLLDRCVGKNTALLRSVAALITKQETSDYEDVRKLFLEAVASNDEAAAIIKELPVASFPAAPHLCFSDKDEALKVRTLIFEALNKAQSALPKPPPVNVADLSELIESIASEIDSFLATELEIGLVRFYANREVDTAELFNTIKRINSTDLEPFLQGLKSLFKALAVDDSAYDDLFYAKIRLMQSFLINTREVTTSKYIKKWLQTMNELARSLDKIQQLKLRLVAFAPKAIIEKGRQALQEAIFFADGSGNLFIPLVKSGKSVTTFLSSERGKVMLHPATRASADIFNSHLQIAQGIYKRIQIEDNRGLRIETWIKLGEKGFDETTIFELESPSNESTFKIADNTQLTMQDSYGQAIAGSKILRGQ